jgi:hypothetical protein
VSRIPYVVGYLVFTSFLTRMGILAGWGYDAGYIGPMLLVITLSFILAVFNDP